MPIPHYAIGEAKEYFFLYADIFDPPGMFSYNGEAKVISLSASKSLPEFLDEALKTHKSLKKDKEFKNRIELIQGLQFSTCSGRVRVSRDGRYIGAVGMYPPDLKVYDTEELSMKFARRVDSEIVDFEFLTDDFRKIVLLQSDRTLEFHHQGGRHHKLRIPHFGRCVDYKVATAELWIGTSTADIYTLDLSQGVFHKPLKSPNLSEASIIKSNSIASSVQFVAGLGGYVEAWDTRTSVSEPVAIWHVATEDDMLDAMDEPAVTALNFNSSGLIMAAGTNNGFCRLFDIRSTDLLLEKDHSIDGPLVDVCFAQIRADEFSEECVISADEKFVKIWKPSFVSKQCRNLAAFESEGTIKAICHYPTSGLLFVGQDHPKVGTHFVPNLGLAPKWSPFLDSVLEDMEQSAKNSFYHDFDFITHADLERLGLTLADVSNKVKPHQHGFLIPRKEYRALREQHGVLSEEALRAEKVREKLAAELAAESGPMRLKVPKKKTLVNADLVAELENTRDDTGDAKRRRGVSSQKAKKKAAGKLLEDDRFKDLFEAPEFARTTITRV